MAARDMEPAAIEIRRVGKLFQFAGQVYLRQAPLRMVRKARAKARRGIAVIKGKPLAKPAPASAPVGHWALKDVTFDVFGGEVLGVIGRNGSGKTTLLKILAQVTSPTTGDATIRGRIAAMLGVGTGFHPLFTGRENIYMSGILLGLTRAEVDERFDAIVEFAEVSDFIDEPVKYYSTGMRARLGYSVAVEMDSSIMLLDEILAVGDQGFQRKCLMRMAESRKEGKTIVLVSHNMNAIKGYCDRVALLEEGTLVDVGKPADIVSYYLSNMFELGSSTMLEDRTDREGSGDLRVDRYWFEDEMGRTVANVVCGETCTLCLHYVAKAGPVGQTLDVAVVITDASGRWLTRLSTKTTHQQFEKAAQAGTMRCTLPKLALIAGEYKFAFRVTIADLLADHVEEAGTFTVMPGDFYGTGRNETHSPLLVEHTWSVAERTTDNPRIKHP